MVAATSAATAAARPHLTVLDFGLRNRTGHHYNLALALIEGASAEDVEIEILAGDTFAEGAGLEGRVRPFFSTDLYLRYRSNADTENYESWLVVNDRLFGDLTRLSAEDLSRVDLLLVPAVTAFHVWAVCRWLKEIVLPTTQASVFIQLMFSPDWSSWGRPSPTGAQMYAEAFALIREAVGQRVFLSAELPASAREYAELLGQPVEVLAHPTLPSSDFAARRRAPSQLITIGAFGYSKREKGFHLLPDVIAAISRSGRPYRFVVQIDHIGDEPEVVQAAQVLQRAAGSNLVLKQGGLEPEAYQSMIESADLVLLPYDPDLYRTRGSGILAEAIGLGRPIVAPAGSGIGEEITAGRAAGVQFSSFDASSVAQAVNDALDDIEALTERACAIAGAGRGRFSGQGYIGKLLTWAGR